MATSPFQPDLGDEERLMRASFFLDYVPRAAKEHPPVRKNAEEVRRTRDALEAIKRKIGKASHRRAKLKFLLDQVAAEALEVLRRAPELLPKDLPSPTAIQARDRFNANYYDFDLPQRLPIDEDEIVEKLGRVNTERYGLAIREVEEIRERLKQAIVAWTEAEKERQEMASQHKQAREAFDNAYMEAKRVLYPVLREKGKEKLLSQVFYDYDPYEDPSAPDAKLK